MPSFALKFVRFVDAVNYRLGRTAKTVESAALMFWDEIAKESETKAKVVEIFKQYNAVMEKAGRPYRYN